MASKLSQKDLQTVARCPLFGGMSMEEIEELLVWLDANERCYQGGELIFLIGDSVNKAGVVLESTVVASFLDESYNNVGLAYFDEGSLFGEALACLKESHSIIEMRAMQNCRLLFLDLSRVLDPNDCDTTLKRRLVGNLIRNFAQKALFLNQKLRILSQRKLRDRVKVFLRTQKTDNDGNIHLPFNRSEWAAFLGVNRSALSRELSALQQEGMIELTGRNIRVVNRSFFSS